MLRIHLFGRLQLSADGRPHPFSGLPKVLPVWAYLLLHRTEPVLRDRLAFTLWPDVPEAEARGNLRRHLYELRRLLPEAPAAQPWVRAERETLQWNPDAPYWLDVAEFERLSADPSGWAEAVALYAGDLLPHLYDEWLIAERERLRERQIETLQRLAAARLAARDYPQASAYARQTLALDPMREDAVRVLMAARRDAGDQTGALREYQALERRLREELDVEPLPETRALYERIKAGERGGATPPAPPPPHRLPAQLTSFLGRAAELDALRQRLAGGARLITLTGPGGSGKTRLGLEAARRALDDPAAPFPDGVFFVPLADVADPAFVPAAIARVLGVPSGQQPPAASLQDFVRAHRLLLLLDNFEQVVEAAPLVVDLLTAAPGLQVLVTSRRVLDLFGEQEFPVPPLPLPDLERLPPAADLLNYTAVALFVERARAVQPDFALTDQNAPVVAEICQRLDGLPLALEMAAARSKLFTPPAMLERLSQRLDFVASAARNLAARQRTLRLTIDWSYHLLDPAEKRWFAQLGVFAGSFTIEAAEAITGEPMLEALAGLTDKSMLRRLPSTDLNAPLRFRLLLTLREYALEQLAAQAGVEAARERHARYYLALAEQAEPHLEGAAQVVWLERLGQEYDNLRAALEWSRAAARPAGLLPRLAAALWRFWMVRGYYAEGRLWLDAALEATDEAAGLEALRARVLRASGDLAWRQGQYEQARRLFEASLSLSQQLGDRLGVARALRGLGFSAYRQADYAQARSLYEASLAVQRELDYPQDVAHLLNNLALVHQRQGDYASARPLFEESLALQRRLGNQQGIANVLNNLGVMALEQGEPAAARAYLEECLALQRALGDKQAVAQSFNNLGNVAQELGQYAEARALFEEGLHLARDIGARWSLAQMLLGVGRLHHRLGEVEAARAAFGEALSLHHESGDKRGLAADLEGLAVVAQVHEGQPERAARLLGAADALRQSLRAPRPPSEHADHAKVLAAVQAQLGGDDFAAAWAAGQALSLEAALALALESRPAT